jgi:electron transfer flavoprotein alpha subunit
VEADRPTVLIFAETGDEVRLTRLTRELVGLGAGLATGSGCALEAVVLGADSGTAAQALLDLGVQKVYAAGDPSLSEYNPDLYLEVLVKLLEGASQVTVLAGHTYVAQDLMPRLAASTGAGLVTDCVGAEIREDGAARFTKPVFGGNAVATYEVRAPVRIATLRARVGSEPEGGSGGGELVAVGAPAGEARVRALDKVLERNSVKLESSRVVVAGGRGIGGADGFTELQELADMLGGAVGASRPPCDSGWIPTTSQVGITGKIVAPDLYIAVAISGSSQHLSGMGESEKIVAINQDADAYIFKVSDYGAAGDWRQLLPAFIEQLKASKG